MKAIERLYEYFDYKGIKPTRFEKEIGLSNGYLGKTLARKADIGSSILVKIIDNCPDLDIVWLITGEGKMIKEDHSISIVNEYSTPYNNKLEILKSILEEKDKEIARLVSIIEMITGNKDNEKQDQKPRQKRTG